MRSQRCKSTLKPSLHLEPGLARSAVKFSKGKRKKAISHHRSSGVFSMGTMMFWLSSKNFSNYQAKPMRKLMSAGRADGRNYNCVWGHMKALYRVLLQTLHESFSSWSGLCIEVQTGSCLDLSLCQNCCEVGFVCCWFFFSSATVRSTINRISFLWRQHQARHHTVWGSNCNTCC